MTYRPELDGIRAFAVLAVIAFHCYLHLGGGGWMGVDVFFVLSGYLITAILLSEKRRTGEVALRWFYARRALRLYPALLVMLVVGAFFFHTLGYHHTLAGYGRSAAAAGLYVEDLVWGLSGNQLGGFGHTWSLAVEEQFYLLWPPLLVWLVARNRRPLRWALGGAVVSVILLVVQTHSLPGGFAHTYYLPWTRFFGLLLGCAVALVVANRAAVAEAGRRYLGWLILVGMGVVLLVGATYSITTNARYLTWQAPAITLLTAALLFHLERVGSHGVGAFLGWKPLAALGRRSYGVYLFHYPVIEVIRDRMPDATSKTLLVLAVPISILLAMLSYRLVEQPALRLKDRLPRRSTSDEGPVEALPAT